jgi:hypothetical protein
MVLSQLSSRSLSSLLLTVAATQLLLPDSLLVHAFSPAFCRPFAAQVRLSPWLASRLFWRAVPNGRGIRMAWRGSGKAKAGAPSRRVRRAGGASEQTPPLTVG